MERPRPVLPFPDPRDTTEASAFPVALPLVPSGGEDDGDLVDLRAVAATLWRGKWIIAVCLLFGMVMGALLTTQQAPVFQAAAKVMFEAPRANLEAGEALVGTTLSQGPLQNQIEVLQSTSLIRRVVKSLDLDKSAVFNPALRPPAPPTMRDRLALPPQIEDLLIAAGLRATPALPPPAPSLTDQAEWTDRIVTDAVLQGLKLRPIDGSRVIEIGFVSGDPQLAARIVNAVAEQYIVDQLEGKLETFRSATAWLTERVADLQGRVEAAEQAVLEARDQAADRVGARLPAVEQRLAALTRSHGEAQTNVTTLHARLARLEGALASGTEVARLPEFRNSQTIAGLSRREADLAEEDKRLSATLRPSHPTRARLAADLSDVRRELEDEAGRLLSVVRLDVDLAEEREAQLGREIAALELKERELSAEAVEIRNLEREAQASRILYENLLARLQETNAQEDLQSADARILTPAAVPLTPLGATQNKTMAVCVVVGLLVGLGLVLLLDKLNNTFRSPAELEQKIGRPVLATVPRIGRRVKRGQVVGTLRAEPNSALAEAVRNLRTSVLFSNVDDPPKVVMFSSSVPREGKSTTATLMALTSRQMGKSAIIVDCDLRMPALSRVLEVHTEKPGLLAVIDGTAPVEEAVHVDPDTGLHVLMTRSPERSAKINAADVLASARFRELIRSLSQTYDLVVLDTPPTLVVTDARIVAGLADATVFCVRWDHTPRPAVAEGLKELQSVNARLTGVVMTLVNEKRAASYAYDGYHYYRRQSRAHYGT